MRELWGEGAFFVRALFAMYRMFSRGRRYDEDQNLLFHSVYIVCVDVCEHHLTQQERRLVARLSGVCIAVLAMMLAS